MKNCDSYRRHTFAAAALMLLWCATAFAADPVKTEDGLLQGTIEDGLRIYRGIPNAAPPIGDLRWKPPQPVANRILIR